MRQAVIVLAVLGVCGSVWGQAPVGPSTAVLPGTRFGLSVEYGRADTDVTLNVNGGLTESFDVQTAFANFAVALTERWDFFLRLGGSQAEADGFDGGWNLAWGFGTRYTVLQRGALGWGALVQVTSLLSDFDTVAVFDVDGVPTPLAITEEIGIVEYALATGPTWQQGPVSVYGGLLLRYTDGDFTITAGRFGERFDVDAQWDVGGYIGGRVTLFESDPARTYGFSRGDLTVEGCFTGDSTGFSAGLLLPFGGAY
jgi:hypothetical protein